MKIFLAVTCYDHKIFGECSEAIFKNSLKLIQAGHTVTPYYSNDLYIDRSRNMCVYLFFESDCDKLVFIDSDMSFDDDAILKLVERDKDIVGGAYPYKQQALDFPVTLDFSRDNNCKEEDTGLVYVTRLPTGLMCIKREVFEKLKEHYNMVPDERNIHQFFRTGMVFPDDPNWWGEDTYFGKRWTDMEGLLFVEPDITFSHIGLQEFKGNYHEHLMGRSVAGLDKEDDGVPGWMSESELDTIKTLASKCDSVVEVGCWKGRTTKALLGVCESVIAVDHWLGSIGDMTKEMVFSEDVFGEFMKNVGHHPNLIVHKGHSADMAKSVDEVDMVFIDAGHTYEECKADIETWLPKCKKIIAGHDYYKGHDGVIRAVNEKFENIKVKDSVWWVEVANGNSE